MQTQHACAVRVDGHDRLGLDGIGGGDEPSSRNRRRERSRSSSVEGLRAGRGDHLAGLVDDHETPRHGLRQRGDHLVDVLPGQHRVEQLVHDVQHPPLIAEVLLPRSGLRDRFITGPLEVTEPQSPQEGDRRMIRERGQDGDLVRGVLVP